MQKYGLMANAEPTASQIACKCCGAVMQWAWSDYSGEAYCLRCGVPHQIKWPKEPQKIGDANYSELGIERAREYFHETGQPCGGGTFLSFDCYPEIRQQRQAFLAWLRARHPEDFEPPPGDE